MEDIKTKLLGKFPDKQDMVDTSILYVQKKQLEKGRDGKLKNHYNPAFILQTIAECIENGFALDGVNYVLTGSSMYMPTYKAYKNKIYQVYPETVIDLQLIRTGDEYKFAKESGSVIYTHNIADPFTNKEPEIVGAYCIIKNNRGEFLETLNKSDFGRMKNASKSPYIWNDWESEFWLKSVIKRACKRHFNDITTAIDEKDNEMVGMEDGVKASDSKKQAIIDAKKAENNVG